MSHFYGTLQGRRGEATRCGDKGSGLVVNAASWKGAIKVELYHDEETGDDRFIVMQRAWMGAGMSQTIAWGVLGKPALLKQQGDAAPEPEILPAIPGRRVIA